MEKELTICDIINIEDYPEYQILMDTEEFKDDKFKSYHLKMKEVLYLKTLIFKTINNLNTFTSKLNNNNQIILKKEINRILFDYETIIKKQIDMLFLYYGLLLQNEEKINKLLKTKIEDNAIKSFMNQVDNIYNQIKINIVKLNLIYIPENLKNKNIKNKLIKIINYSDITFDQHADKYQHLYKEYFYLALKNNKPVIKTMYSWLGKEFKKEYPRWNLLDNIIKNKNILINSTKIINKKEHYKKHVEENEKELLENNNE